MTFTLRPAKREKMPLVIGLAGPTKSGKTYSAHRIAVGLANGGPIAMLNAEGEKGHQYADEFTYLAADITAPYRPERYTEALSDILASDPKPAVIIVDSMTHMHNGPGGMLEYHRDELDRIAGNDRAKRDRNNFNAWIVPKAAENQFIYTLLGADSHIILCFRAKEKLKLQTGKAPVELGWQPIASESIPFETIFTLVLPPHCKGVPDLEISDMRKPFDKLIPAGEPLSEETGRLLAQWAAGSGSGVAGGAPNPPPAAPDGDESDELVSELRKFADEHGSRETTDAAIEKNRGFGDPVGHLMWLRAQVELVRAREAELVSAGSSANEAE